MKVKRISAGISAFILMACIISYLLSVDKLKINKQIHLFCSITGIICDKYELSDSRNIAGKLMGLISYATVTPFKIYLTEHDKYGNVIPLINFVIDNKSGEIEYYKNDGLIHKLHTKYGSKAWPSTDINWPPFIPEMDAEQIIHSISLKLKMPSDMVAMGIQKDEKRGIWTVRWRREMNGFQYENDGAVISIMGATGDFVEYHKTYEGTQCSTKVDMSEADALKKGWELFINTAVPEELRSQAHVLYRADVSPRIVQPNVLRQKSPFSKSKGSRLAWIVRFVFTGGVKEIKEPEHPTEAEENAYSVAIDMRDDKWFELGRPQREFEIRYDAETGETLESSPVQSACDRRFIK